MHNCSNHRGINLTSAYKIYFRIIIARLIKTNRQPTIKTNWISQKM